MKYFESIQETLRIEADTLNEAINRVDSSYDLIIEALLSVKGKVILFGVGKSGHIATKISATLSSTGTPSFFVHPTESMHGDLGMVSPSDAIIAISYSGETVELITPLKYLRDRKILIVGMSKSKDSTLGKLSDYHIDIHIKKEACPLNSAPTSSTTLTLAMGDALAIALMRAKGFKETDFATFHPGGALGKRLFVKVKDLMRSKDLPIVKDDTTLKESLVIMSEGKLGTLVVVNNSQKILGIVTDGDIRRIIVNDKFDIDAPISTYISKNFKSIAPNKLAVEALEIMQRDKIQVLIVTQDGNSIDGIIHIHKLVEEGIKCD